MKRSLFVAMMLAIAPAAHAASFVNGDFEAGTSAGWTTGSGYRGNVLNSGLDPADVLPGGSLYTPGLVHSSIVTAGGVAETGGALNQVYSGNFSWRVEDTTTGGYASAITQTVLNYTDPDIFFAWAAVLEGAHGTNDAATIKIVLDDLTTGTNILTRNYNAASGGGGVDPRFNYHAPTNHYWTPWQVENLPIGAAAGHDLRLSILASDCQPTAHEGFLFLDGFGAVAPPAGPGEVPEPASLVLLGTGLVGAAYARRRKVMAKV